MALRSFCSNDFKKLNISAIPEIMESCSKNIVYLEHLEIKTGKLDVVGGFYLFVFFWSFNLEYFMLRIYDFFHLVQ